MEVKGCRRFSHISRCINASVRQADAPSTRLRGSVQQRWLANRVRFRQQGQRLPFTFKRVGETDSQSSLTLRKVDVGGHSLNLLIGGQGSPAVVFEGGFGAGGRKSSQFN
jgi:hypothetical protein